MKVITTWKHLPKHCISAGFLLIVSYIQGALIASFIELFKNTNLGKSYRQTLPALERIYLNVAFLQNFTAHCY